MYTSGFRKTLVLRRNNASNTKPNSPSTSQSLQLSPHIVDCAREDIERTDSGLFVGETRSTTVSNMKTAGAENKMEFENSRFRLWPRAAAAGSTSNAVEHKDQALAAGRSPTSLSDTAIIHSHRGGSLLRRRNVSVPELKDKVIVQSVDTGDYADSPTIPGRPPLRRVNTDVHGHERSASVPSTWRQSPFSNAMLSAVAGPFVKASPSNQARVRLAPIEQAAHYVGHRPLSPILSPTATKTPMTAIHRSPSPSPMQSHFQINQPLASQFPAEGNTQSPIFMQSPELDGGQTFISDHPPPVPPKDDSSDLPVPVKADAIAKRANFTRGHVRGKLSFGSVINIPPMPWSSPQPPSRVAPALPKYVSPTSKSESSIPAYRRVASPDLSMMDRPRPLKGSLRKQKSAPILSRAASDDPSRHPREATLLAGAIEPQKGEGCLPTGLRPMEALLVLPNSEKDIIRKQAVSQAEKFEILGSKLVIQLSRELRALDERCEYLRKTYKSLRTGRQKLHMRMITYLKSDTLIFSKERLLKQQEALIELDSSIDDWVSKLERAENRRLRLRQKLLEHVAASMILSTPYKSTHGHDREPSTPPRSPVRQETVITSPQSYTQSGRKDVESIKIYADNISLFRDIEAAVTNMCEAC